MEKRRNGINVATPTAAPIYACPATPAAAAPGLVESKLEMVCPDGMLSYSAGLARRLRCLFSVRRRRRPQAVRSLQASGRTGEGGLESNERARDADQRGMVRLGQCPQERGKRRRRSHDSHFRAEREGDNHRGRDQVGRRMDLLEAGGEDRK